MEFPNQLSCYYLPRQVLGTHSAYLCNTQLSCKSERPYEGVTKKFPDWVDNEIYAYNNKHSLRSNIKGYGGKTH